MNESRFNDLAEQVMSDIEDAVEECGVDIDYDNVGNVLTLEFNNGSQIIVNKQTPLSQIWVAARSGGYHFDYNEEHKTWVLDSNPQAELFECLSQYCTGAGTGTCSVGLMLKLRLGR